MRATRQVEWGPLSGDRQPVPLAAGGGEPGLGERKKKRREEDGRRAGSYTRKWAAKEAATASIGGEMGWPDSETALGGPRI